MEHDWDRLTQFCRACGAGLVDVVERRRPRQCEGGGNLVAISDRRARQRWAQLGLHLHRYLAEFDADG